MKREVKWMKIERGIKSKQVAFRSRIQFLMMSFRAAKKHKKNDNDMDVDDDEADDTEDEEGEEEEESANDKEDGDDQQTPRKSPKKKKSKTKKAPRKSELDMTALTNEQAALAALESDQLLHLRLRKKYYVEALNFIRLVENSMEIMAQLLGSTNKAEVLESMEFFRVAYEYQFDGAKVLFKMPYTLQ
jgi:condensin complex subunit 1